MKKVGFSKAQIGMMVAVPVVIVCNPLTVEIFIDYIKWGLAGVSAVAALYVIGFVGYCVFRPQPVKVPTKNKKTEKLPKQLQYEV